MPLRAYRAGPRTGRAGLPTATRPPRPRRGGAQAMSPDLYRYLLAALRQLDSLLVTLAAEVPEDYPLLYSLDLDFDPLRRELAAAKSRLKAPVVAAAFDRA